MGRKLLYKLANLIFVVLLFCIISSCNSMPKFDISVGKIDASNNYTFRNIHLELPRGWKLNEELRNEIIRARKVSARTGSETTRLMNETILDCILLENEDAEILMWIHEINPRYSENDIKQQFSIMLRKFIKNIRVNNESLKKRNQIPCRDGSHQHLSKMSMTCDLHEVNKKITMIGKYVSDNTSKYLIWFILSRQLIMKNKIYIKQFEAMIQSVSLTNE